MDERTEQQPTAGKAASALKEFAETIIVALVIFLLLQVVVKNFRITGDSMLPTFRDGQFLLVDRLTYYFTDPKRGDVIVFRYPRNPAEDFIKRVIGLPGETVNIADGQVYINGIPLVEPYVNGVPTTIYRGQPVTLDAGEYYVLGDNRRYSSDSRVWGPVPRDNIIGRAWLCYWPPTCWHVIHSPSYP